MHSEHSRRLTLVTSIPVRWGDMDALGHVNNTVYFRFMEQARIEWMTAYGYGSYLTEEGPVIANASCNFRIPITYPATVEVSMFLADPGRSSVMTSYELRVKGDDRVFADGTAKLVWISTRTGRSIPLPDALRTSALGGDTA